MSMNAFVYKAFKTCKSESNYTIFTWVLPKRSAKI